MLCNGSDRDILHEKIEYCNSIILQLIVTKNRTLSQKIARLYDEISHKSCGACSPKRKRKEREKRLLCNDSDTIINCNKK